MDRFRRTPIGSKCGGRTLDTSEEGPSHNPQNGADETPVRLFDYALLMVGVRVNSL